MALSSPSSARLRKITSTVDLYPGQSNIVDVVYVPELGSQASESSSLREMLSRTPVPTQFFEFVYGHEQHQVWHNLIQRSDDLLEELLKQEMEKQKRLRLRVFVCHGLGGIIVKRLHAMLSDKYYNPAYQRLLRTHAGTVFLGTPHPTFARRDQWIKLSHILRSSRRFSQAALAQAEIEAAIISSICLKFEQSAFTDPVVSVYETKPTKISEGLFRSRKELLVDETFMQTRVRDERPVPADADHFEVHKITEKTLVYDAIESLIISAGKQAVDLDLDSQSLAELAVLPLDDYAWESSAADMNAQNSHEMAAPGSGVTPADATLATTETQKSEGMAALTDFTAVRSPKLPCYLLKALPENPDFLGREDVLDRIEKVLRPPEDVIDLSATNCLRSVALCGFGGIGKTQIALYFAFAALKKRHYDAIFWVQADNLEKLGECFQQIAIELGLVDPNETTDAVVAKNVVMQWLSKPTRKPRRGGSEEMIDHHQDLAKWLIIFDNADNPELMPEFWPTVGIGSVLLTSRSPRVQTYLRTNESIDILPFEASEAGRLLQNLTFSKDIADNVKEFFSKLGEMLEGYPLALIQTAAFMLRKDITAKEMFLAYKEKSVRRELYEVKSTSPFNKYQYSLSTVWLLEKFSESASQLLDVLSYLDPDNIHESILQHPISEVTSKTLFDIQAFYLDARSELVMTSLVKRNKIEQTLIVHRIVQEGVRNRMSKEQKSNVFVHVVTILLQSWTHETEEKFTHLQANWAVARQVSPNVIELEKLYKEEQNNLHLSNDVMLQFARLLQKSGWYHNEQGYFHTSLPLLEHSLKICEQLEFDEEFDILHADILFGLATVSSQQNKLKEALHYARRHFEVRIKAEEKRGAMTRHGGLAYTEMACCLMLNDKFDEALEYSRSGFEILINLPLFRAGKYWPDFAVISGAYSLIGLNRGPEAIQMLQDAVDYRERRFGVDDKQSDRLGYHLQILGNIYSRQGDWEVASALFQRALTNIRATVGSQHYRAGQVCTKLGEYHSSRSEVEAASIYFEQALSIFELYPHTKPELARTMHKKAIFLQHVGNQDDADQLFSQARVLYKALKPDFAMKEWKTPTEDDFDGIVAIWSR